MNRIKGFWSGFWSALTLSCLWDRDYNPSMVRKIRTASKEKPRHSFKTPEELKQYLGSVINESDGVR